MAIDLEELKRLREGAVTLPWKWHHLDPETRSVDCRMIENRHGFPFCQVDDPQSGQYIVAACNSLPELIEKLERCRSVISNYSDSYNYGDGNGVSWSETWISKDRGDSARKALKEVFGEGEE